MSTTQNEKISLEDAARIARLARLQLSEDMLERFAGECNDILNYMELLGDVDTAGVEPMYSPAAHATPYREDRIERQCTREDVLANAPRSDGQFFIVPRIV